MQVRVLQGADWNDDKAEARWARRAWEGLGDDEPDDYDDDDEEFTSLTQWRDFVRDVRARRGVWGGMRSVAGR